MPESRTRGHYGRYLREVLTVIDLLVVNAVFGVLCILHPEITDSMVRLKWLAVNISYLAVTFLFGRTRMQRTLHIDRVLVGSLKAVLCHALVFVTLLVFLNADDGISIGYYVELYAMMFVALPLTWLSTRAIIKALRHRGMNYRRVVIVGTNPTGRRLYETLVNDEGYGYRILGFFDKNPMPGFAGTYCGPLERLEAFIVDNKVDEVFYALSGENEADLLHCIEIADETMVQFHFVPKISPYVGRRFELDSLGGLPVLTPLVNPLSRSFNRIAKRAFDIAFSSVALACSPILFIPISIAVKLSSPGPVFFKQKRTGYRGREFTMYKFRTMRLNAEADRHQATSDDPRKTRVGDFLRRTSLDELPQFINVWLGNMSIVGPRPHMLAHTEQYKALIDRYMIRHMVKPGITGWAQVCGFRGNTEELIQMERRVNADVWYIEHWSMALDIKIIMKTIVNAVRGEENAY